MCDKCAEAVVKARDLIGDKAGDITGAALDAWVALGDAARDHEPGEPSEANTKEDEPRSNGLDTSPEHAKAEADSLQVMELRAARAETWDEAIAAVFAWWSAPEDERPLAIVNPYGVGLGSSEPADLSEGNTKDA